MRITHASNGFSAGSQPDPMLIGAEKMVMWQRPDSLQAAIHESFSDEKLGKDALKPEIPKKNEQLEEVYRLRQQPSQLQADNEHFHNPIGLNTSDLEESVQQEISKRKELEEKEIEIASTGDKALVLLAQLDQAKHKQAELEAKLREKEAELARTREKISLLSSQLDTEKETQTRVEEKLREQETSTHTHNSKMQQQIESLFAMMERKGIEENGDVSRLQEEVVRLTSLVSAREEELKKNEAASDESEKRLKSKVQDQDAQLEELEKKEARAVESEKRLANQLQEQTARLEEEHRLRETAEAALGVQQQQASTGLEMAELRRLCDYYMENSQRLSKKIKLASTNRDVKDAQG